jgi:hypothetical protein
MTDVVGQSLPLVLPESNEEYPGFDQSCTEGELHPVGMTSWIQVHCASDHIGVKSCADESLTSDDERIEPPVLNSLLTFQQLDGAPVQAAASGEDDLEGTFSSDS